MLDKDAVVALISDMQVGSTIALCPPSWNLYDGGTFRASPGQKIIHRQWLKSADEVRGLRKEGRSRKQLVLVLNGEPIDGVHHDTRQLITNQKTEQIEMAIGLLDEWMQLAEYSPKHGDRMYIVRGTTAHEKGEYLNQIGRDLDGVIAERPDSKPGVNDGRYYFDKLRRVVNDNLFDIAHHGFSRGSNTWLRSNTLRWRLISMYYECLEEGMPIPNYVIRSHNHVYTHDTFKQMWGCITPCWSMKTNFVYKIASNSHINTIGMVYFDVLKSGHSKPYAEYIKVLDTKVLDF